jgi:hypothetical protein
MLDSLALAHPVQGYNARFHAVSIADTGPKAVRLLDRAHDQKASRTSTLDRYLEGWAEANLGKILDATAPKYRFRDPFVGSFTRRRLHEYFDLLQDRLPARERSGGPISPSSCEVQWTGRRIYLDFSSGVRRPGSGLPESLRSKSENEV